MSRVPSRRKFISTPESAFAQTLTIVSCRDIVEGVAFMLSDLAGGATAQTASVEDRSHSTKHFADCSLGGYWVARDGALVSEKVTIVTSSLDLSPHRIEISCMAAFVADSMAQQSVLMKYVMSYRISNLTRASCRINSKSFTISPSSYQSCHTR
jgi:hypothetical protein